MKNACEVFISPLRVVVPARGFVSCEVSSLLASVRREFFRMDSQDRRSQYFNRKIQRDEVGDAFPFRPPKVPAGITDMSEAIVQGRRLTAYGEMPLVDGGLDFIQLRINSLCSFFLCYTW